MIPLQGRTIDGYQFHEVLGEGGMGVVYRATQLSLDRPVAFKVLSQEVSEHAEALKRFRRETLIHTRLDHPNVVTVFDCGVIQGFPYLSMELVEGSSLGMKLRHDGWLEVGHALALAHQIADALVYLHVQGVIHRDLKPANLLMAATGVIKVTDFGLSRQERGTALTADSEMLGTLPYMPPEVFMGDKQGPAADVYALGLILHEMLTGRMAITAETPYELAQQVIHQDIPLPGKTRPDVPPRVDALLARMLHKDPARRPDPGLVRGELQEIARGIPGEGSRLLIPSIEASRVVETETADLESSIVLTAGDPAVQPSAAPAAAPPSRSPAPVVVIGGLLVLGVVFLGSGARDQQPWDPGTATVAEVPDGFDEAFEPELLVRKMREDCLEALRHVDRYDRATPSFAGEVGQNMVFLRDMGESQVGYSPFRGQVGDVTILIPAITGLCEVVRLGDEAGLDDPFWLDADRIGWEILSEVISSRGLSEDSPMRPELDRLRAQLDKGGKGRWRRALADSCRPFLEGRMDSIVTSLTPVIQGQIALLKDLEQMLEVWQSSPRGWLVRLNLRHRIEHLWRMEVAARGSADREEPEKRRVAWVLETFHELGPRYRGEFVADPDVVVWTNWLTFYTILDALPHVRMSPGDELTMGRIAQEVLPRLAVERLPPLGALAACDSARVILEEARSIGTPIFENIAAWSAPCEEHRKRSGEYTPLFRRNRRGHVPP